MAGTVDGGKKAAKTNIETYGKDWFKRIGAMGGRKSGTGGFYYLKQMGDTEKIVAAGRVGGSRSKRGKLDDTTEN
jgi:general stress protein YciG